MATKAKFKFDATPKSFPGDVEIVKADGSTAYISFNFKYRTRAEFAEFADKHLAMLKAEQKKLDAEDVPDRTIAEWFAMTDANNIPAILDSVQSWDLDDTLDKTSLARLENEYPGSLAKISLLYRQVCADGRVKNSKP